MTAYVDRTLQAQIERGEVFFHTLNYDLIGGLKTAFVFEPGTTPVSLRVGLGSLSKIALTLYDGSDGKGTGSTFSPVNMNFEVGGTPSYYTEEDCTPSTFGTKMAQEIMVAGVPRVRIQAR